MGWENVITTNGGNDHGSRNQWSRLIFVVRSNSPLFIDWKLSVPTSIPNPTQFLSVAAHVDTVLALEPTTGHPVATEHPQMPHPAVENIGVPGTLGIRRQGVSEGFQRVTPRREVANDKRGSACRIVCSPHHRRFFRCARQTTPGIQVQGIGTTIEWIVGKPPTLPLEMPPPVLITPWARHRHFRGRQFFRMAA